jgi:hypothetical protein
MEICLDEKGEGYNMNTTSVGAEEPTLDIWYKKRHEIWHLIRMASFFGR